MLVIVVQTSGISAEHVPWTGRRHDEDGPDSTGTPSAQGLFDAVFHALHDGEQVAIGFDCPLAVAADGVDAADAASAIENGRTLDGGPGIEQLRRLVTELGHWRPWTIVTTSLPRWRATTSVLLWEAIIADGTESPALSAALSAIDAFYDLYATAHGDEQPGIDDQRGALINLAAVAAAGSDVTADPAEATRPVLRVAVQTPLVTTT